VRASLPCHEPSEAATLLEGAAAPPRFARGLAIAVLQGDAGDKRAAVVAGLRDRRPEVRAAALNAAAYALDAGLLAPVAALCEQEPERRLRNAATRLLVAIEAARSSEDEP
jgi:hypothetical protein